MKEVLIAVFAIAGSLISIDMYGDVAKDKKPSIEQIRKMTQYEKEMLIKERRARAERNLGGFLVFPSTGNVVRVVNDQRLVDKETVLRLSDMMCQTIGMSIEVVEAGAAPNPKEAARIYLVENNSAPVLLIAPEDKEGTLNVSRLTKDKPDRKLLDNRFAKEYWRVMGMTLGSFISNLSPCIMRNIFSLKDLDADPSVCPSPVIYDKIQQTCRKLGITRSRRISYRRACLEGIAPPPTNDIQKAIWERIKADKERGPTNPLTIPPPKKK